MEPTIYQPGEIYVNGQLYRAGAFGPNTPFWNDDGTGIYDYIVNDLEILYSGVGGAAENASKAQINATLAVAMAEEAMEWAEEAAQSAAEAKAAQAAAEDAQAAAEDALERAAAIATPDGLAARVVALETAPHFEHDATGKLFFVYEEEV